MTDKKIICPKCNREVRPHLTYQQVSFPDGTGEHLGGCPEETNLYFGETKLKPAKKPEIGEIA